jgi:hypothetical protein
MRARTALCAGALMLAATILALPGAPARAAATVLVPAGTPVGLKFITPVASDRIAAGVKAGTPTTGTVTQVTRPGAFGTSAKIVIGSLTADAVDGRSG